MKMLILILGFLTGFATLQAQNGTPCSNQPTVTYGDKTYNTVQIGERCWLRENLNVGTMILSDQEQTNNGSIEKYCYGNQPGNCDIYGGLYQWNEMMQHAMTPGSQGICPEGWVIPTDQDWCALTASLDSTVGCGAVGFTGTTAGGALKETGLQHWYAPNTGATNQSGFTGLPGGSFAGISHSFNNLGCFGYFHTSSTNGYSQIGRWVWLLSSEEEKPSRISFQPGGGYSVRCIRKADWVPQLSVTPQILQVDSLAGSVIINVSANLDWSVTESVDWLTVSPATGYFNGTFTVNYDAYATASSRTGQITITATCGAPSVALTITQMGQFTCGEPYNDPRDGKTYETVRIGIQCWMQQNLNAGTRINGSVNQANNGILEKYCYNNDEANCTIYGAMYQWNEAMQYTTASGAQGVCMGGWHLPTWDEYGILKNYVRSQPSYRCDYSDNNTAKALASENLWNASANLCAIGNDPASNNLTGFSGLPGGSRSSSVFSAIGNGGYWYTSSVTSVPIFVWAFNLAYDGSQTMGTSGFKSTGYSVRCVHNQNIALALNVEPVHRDVGAAAGNTSFGVTSNTGWKVEESSEWITVNPLTGVNNDAITVSYDENPSAEPRTAQVTVKTYNGTISVNITVTQAGSEGTILVVTPAVQQVSAEAGVAGFQVFSNSAWLVSKNEDWFAVNPASGELNDTIKVTYNENSTSAVRSGEIMITSADSSETAVVTLIQSRLPACGQPITDPRDGKIYNTIQMGTQCWMKQNLNLGTFLNISQNQTNNSIYEKYCYENLESNCDPFGGLYQWDEAMQYSEIPSAQGICMPGWHLPSDTEWDVLRHYLIDRPEYSCDGIDIWTAKSVASTSGWETSTSTCTPGFAQATNNSTGFTMIPGGYKYSNGFTPPGWYSAFWSSTPADSQNARWWFLEYSRRFLDHGPFYRSFGMSVRCLRNE